MRGRLGPLVALDRYPDAIEQAKKLIARSPNDLFAWFWRWVLESDPTIRVRYPQLRGSDLKRMFSEPVRSLPDRARLDEAIDRLGLPE
jgi:hypothetical protein